MTKLSDSSKEKPCGLCGTKRKESDMAFIWFSYSQGMAPNHGDYFCHPALSEQETCYMKQLTHNEESA